ncbi:Pls/PosA family non-ribosomal peptide synthetase [Kitasatospora sp. NPDC089797]|uniref:Pls/PosA family non-ribosomal peptide synthetase n=1 Tax=Kitasatospora sp. NPDC089797 TaxID=3155298 RepID=UPI003442D882
MDARHDTAGPRTLHRPNPGQAAGWPVAQPSHPRSLLDVIAATADAHPHAPALDTGDAVLDYRTLMQEVDALAGVLAGHGIGTGDRVGVRIPSGTADLYVAILAVLRCGAAYVPVDADDPDERAEMIWQDAQVCAVLGAERRLAAGPAARPSGHPAWPTPADDAWIIFTSGTTGRPKGVAVTHRSAAAFVDAEARIFLRTQPLGPGDRVLAGLSVAFDASCEEMWLAWRHGACLVPAPRSLVKAGTDLGPWLVQRRITAISTVPTLLALWPQECLDQVRLIIVGGEACPAELVERLAVPGREFWNTYGPTETTVVATAARMLPGEPVRIGAPLDGWEIAVVDPDGRPVPWYESGELLISGIGTARYLDPAKDAEKYSPHPAIASPRVYRSGDLVRNDPEGLVFLGRADDQIKLGGRRIELGEIDAALQALPGIRAAAAAVRKTPAGADLLVGYLVAQPGTGTDLADARQHLLERLPAPLVPVLAVVDSLPTKTSGKVDRNALPWPLATTGGADRPAETLEGTAGWLAGQWERLLGMAPGCTDDFFALGGSSLTAARLVSELRTRHSGVSVADLYAHPVLGDLADYLDSLAPAPRPAAAAAGPESAATTAPARRVRPTPRSAGFWQTLMLLAMFGLSGLRWVVVLIAVDNLMGSNIPWAPHSSWWPVVAGAVLFYSAPGRTLLAAGGARLLTAGIRPGSHPRGGQVHLRLWAAERYTAMFGTGNLTGTPWAARYARMLGCRVGKGVQLHTAPPVTGLARIGDGATLEPEADIVGWWLDGDILQLGHIEIGEGASIGHRATLMPGARIGAGAEIAPGSCVTGAVPAGEHWHGSPARPSGEARTPWPTAPAKASRVWNLAYGFAFVLFGLAPVIAALPALFVIYPLVDTQRTLGSALLQVLPLTVPLAALSFLCYAALIALLIRLFSLPLRPGFHPATGRVAFCAWAVSHLSDGARRALFPFYASLFTPVWLRLLGARIGHRVEASTVLALPTLMRVEDGAFLADDTLVAPYELRGSWLHLGRAHVGRRSFVGNSGIVGPGRSLPDNSLVGVLSDTPVQAPEGSSWLGRPAFALPRVADSGGEARTYDPPKRLMWARAGVEVCRLLPIVIAALLADLVFAALQAVRDDYGLGAAVGAAGLVLVAAAVLACAIATLAKWLLVGRFRVAEHPLWSSFVWRNELYDTFVEELAMPFGGGAMTGTPYLNLWLRSLGAKIGRGAWCETHWLPESDLVTVGAGASVNRGTVLQTHLFHDRVMRLGPVHLGTGATTGPHSIVLLNSSLGDTTTVGPASLVMRGESVPGGTRWLGNPVAAWDGDPAPPAGRRASRGRRRAGVM